MRNPSTPGEGRSTVSRLLMGFLAALVAVALLWILACRADAGAGGDGPRSAEAVGSPMVEAAGGDTLRAWAACTEFVRRRLEANPDGATFPFPHNWGEVLLEQTGRRWSLRVRVEADSPSLAWRCRLRFVGDGWELEGLRIRGR